jgi:hypothetical protein
MRGVPAEQRPAIVLEYHGELGWPAIGTLRDAGYAFELSDGTPLATPESSGDVPYHVVARPASPPHQ